MEWFLKYDAIILSVAGIGIGLLFHYLYTSQKKNETDPEMLDSIKIYQYLSIIFFIFGIAVAVKHIFEWLIAN